MTREKKLQEIIGSKEPYTYKELMYKESRRKMAVYEIPVEYLVFNQYNGRIGTFVKQYEQLHGPIDATTQEGEELIVNFLWNSKVSRNKQTKRDIEEKGQLEYGIVTKDGVIIDGNRRCMIMKRIAGEKHLSPTYFLAVVLDETLESNPKEIRKLETTFQMGVDAKVDYNPIEKYLKCKELVSDGFDYEEIARMMGEKLHHIKEYLDILSLMEEYLEEYGYSGMYRILDEARVEGPFVDLRGYLDKQLTGRNLHGRDWSPEADDVDDLKSIYFDMVRSGFGAHELRHIGNPAKTQGLFNYEKLWKEHSDTFFESMDAIKKGEESLDYLRESRHEEPVESIIAGREEDFQRKTKAIVKAFLGNAERALSDRNDNDKPLELLTRALATLKQIDTSVEGFEGNGVMNLCDEINELAYSFKETLKNKEMLM